MEGLYDEQNLDMYRVERHNNLVIILPYDTL